jgi:hypothetical protein
MPDRARTDFSGAVFLCPRVFHRCIQARKKTGLEYDGVMTFLKFPQHFYFLQGLIFS